jgi:LuxR family maltose regulon positive regulatory protein
MPKPARFTLVWSQERDLYELYDNGQLLLQADGAPWLSWLTTHTAFAFRGKHGRFNLLKETRKQNGEGYWYAYQRQGKRTTKRYVGRSVEVVLARLEEIGRAFVATSSSLPLSIEKFLLPEEETVRTVVLQASRWYEQWGQVTKAIELVLQVQGPKYAASMIERYLMQHGFDDLHEFPMLRRWLEQLPTDILALYPLLCLHKAQILSLSFVPEQPPPRMLAQMDTLLQMAEARWHAQGNTARLGEVYAFRASLAIRQGAQERACSYARQALHWLPPSSQRWRGVCLNLLGADALSHGQLIQAQELLQEALTIWTNLHHPHGARSCMLLLAALYFEQGALQVAAACYRRVVYEAREVGDREDLIPALIGLAQISYEWNDLEVAAQLAQEAWDMSEQMGSPELLMRATFVLIRLCFLHGEKALVQQHLASLLARCAARPDLSAEVRLCQMHYWLMEGDVTTVQHHLDALTIPAGEAYTRIREQQQLLQLRVFLERKKQHQDFEALERLQTEREWMLQELQLLMTGLHLAGRRRMLLELQLLMTRLHLAEKRIEDAHQLLSAALLFAHTEGYLRTFLDEGQELAALLHLMRAHVTEAPLLKYLQTLLHAFAAEPDTPHRVMAEIEPLSRQEQRVLRLVLAELSYPEIARELVVSVNTVKTHVNHIYRKLNVHSRREARSVVLDLHLLSSQR